MMNRNNDEKGQSLQDIFLMALDKPSETERIAFLDDVCGIDTKRRRKVEALLSNLHDDDFLERAAVERSGVTNTIPGSTMEKQGLTIGRYKLLENIGEGGCGVVYVAEQEKPFRRRVALKVIKLGMDTRSVIARFEAERQALALMDHPNIAKVLDAGATDKGRPYFVMELVRGVKITDYCDQCKLPTRQRLELFIKVCRAIQHAHQKGIIHRDIKPSNVLVTLHDGVPVPKVIDFGISKAMADQRLTDKTVYTQLHQFIGTPSYMSPEQAEMSSLDIDTRSDIYSLGVLLYELIVGKKPFDLTALLASGLDELRRTIREQEPVRPSTRVRTMLKSDQSRTVRARDCEVNNLIHLLSGDLDWIVMKCLEKDRSQRYDTANGLAVDIQRHLNQEPVLARPPSSAYRVQKFIQRNKLMVTTGSAIVAALVLGILSSSWQAMRATRAEREQTRLRVSAEEAKANETHLRKLAQLQTYAADMKAAQVALQENNRAVTINLLRQYLPKPGDEDLRGVEWRFLWEASRSDELLNFPHSTRVHTAVLTPDDRHLATLDGDGTFQVWELPSANRIINIESRGSAGDILCRRLDCTTDGRWLAVAGNNVVEIWDTAVWRVTRTLRDVTHPLRFSPDGRFLATQGTNGLWVWNLNTWAHRELTNALPRPTSLAFSPDGSRLVSASGRSNLGYHIQFWDTETGMEIARTETDSRVVVAISPDGNWLASGHWTGGVTLWDLASRNQVQRFQAHPVIYSLAFSRDGTQLATGGSDQLIHLWETGTTNRISTFQGHENEVWSLHFSRDGRKLVSSSKDTTAKLWDTTEKATRIQSFELPTDSKPEGVLPDGSALVTLNSPERMTQLWSLPDGRLLRSLDWSQFEEKGCRFFWHFPANESVIGRTTTGTFHFWSLRTGKHLTSFALAAANAEPVCFSDDFHWLLVRTAEKQLELHDLRTAQQVMRFKDYDWNAGYSVGSFSPDGQWLAYGTTNNAVKIWDLGAHREKAILMGVQWHVVPIQWSPNSRLLAGAGWDSPVCLWSVESGDLLFPPMKGHQAGTKFAMFSSDGKTLITDSEDNITRWWNVATGREVLLLQNKTRVWHGRHTAPATSWDLGGRFLVWEEPPGVIQVMTLPALAEIAITESQRNKTERLP